MTNEEAKIHNQRIASIGMKFTVDLLAHPSYEWFIENCIVAEQAELDKMMKNPLKSKDEREGAMHRWIALEKVRTWAPEQRAAYGNMLGFQPSEIS